MAIAAVIWIGNLYAKGQSVIAPCLALWTMLLTLGLLNEGREGAHKLELIRLLAVVPATILYLQYTGVLVSSAVLVGAIVYLLGSVVWLTYGPVFTDKAVIK